MNFLDMIHKIRTTLNRIDHLTLMSLLPLLQCSLMLRYLSSFADVSIETRLHKVGIFIGCGSSYGLHLL